MAKPSTQRQTAIGDLVEELKARPDVLGVALFGSVARGNARPDSDVDVFVLIEEGSWRDAETRDGIQFEFVYSSPEANREFGGKRPDDYLTMWRAFEVLFDRSGALGELRREASALDKAGKPRLDDKARAHRRFDAEDQLRAAETLQESDPSTANLVLGRLLEALGILYFDLRGEWAPAPKQRLAVIRKQDPALGTAFDASYTAANAAERLAAAHTVAQKIFG